VLERSKGRTRLFENRSPSRNYWLETGAGKSGVIFAYIILKDHARIELYIDSTDQQKNKQIFDILFTDREAIEMEFGDALDWQRLDEKQASRIAKRYYGYGSLYEPETWDELADTLIGDMIKFEKTFRKRIQQLDV
jgi:hypothetical protein